MRMISRKNCFKPTNELMNKCMGRLSCNCRILLISRRFINPAKLINQLAFTHSPIQNLSLHMHLPFYAKSFSTFLRHNQFQNFVTLVAKPSFIYTHPKFIEVIFSFPEFLSTCRKTVYSIFLFLIYSQFYSSGIKYFTPIFDHVYWKNIKSTFNFHGFFQHTKNVVISFISFRVVVDLKILQSAQSTPFRPISPEPSFPQIRAWCRPNPEKNNE